VPILTSECTQSWGRGAGNRARELAGEAAAGDVFLEAPDGIWIPLPQPSGQAENGARRFVVDLADGADIDDLKGRRIRVTLVGSDGQAEAGFDMVEAN
jgi:hypothetical protein